MMFSDLVTCLRRVPKIVACEPLIGWRQPFARAAAA